MTIIREPIDPAIVALEARAAESGGAEFADGLRRLVESYRGFDHATWPQWPSSRDTRDEAERIMTAATELARAYAEASERVRARMGYHLDELGLARHTLDTGGELYAMLGLVGEAAAKIYRDQPVDKHGKPARRKDESRNGFVLMLREHFDRYGVRMTATASESTYTGETYTSLAVDAVVTAFDLTEGAARKAIRDALKRARTDL